MDGHSTHYCPQVINKALESKVILFCLPPNTTHLTQPLDKGCFSPLKMSWRKKCQSFLNRHSGRVVTKYEFSRLFGEVWLESMSMSNVIAGFRCTGIFPLDRAALLPNLSAPHATTLSERYEVNFIPTYIAQHVESSPLCPKVAQAVTLNQEMMKASILLLCSIVLVSHNRYPSFHSPPFVRILH